jgi:uncharacterized protein YfaA (DUF2138 family)
MWLGEGVNFCLRAGSRFWAITLIREKIVLDLVFLGFGFQRFFDGFGCGR